MAAADKGDWASTTGATEGTPPRTCLNEPQDMDLSEGAPPPKDEWREWLIVENGGVAWSGEVEGPKGIATRLAEQVLIAGNLIAMSTFRDIMFFATASRHQAYGVTLAREARDQALWSGLDWSQRWTCGLDGVALFPKPIQKVRRQVRLVTVKYHAA